MERDVMEKQVKDMKDQLDKLDLYTKNTVGFLERKVKDMEEENKKLLDMLYQEVMAMGNFVNGMFVQLEGLCDLLVSSEVVSKDALIEAFKSKQEAIDAALKKKATADQTGFVDVNGNKVASGKVNPVKDDVKEVTEDAPDLPEDKKE